MLKRRQEAELARLGRGAAVPKADAPAWPRPARAPKEAPAATLHTAAVRAEEAAAWERSQRALQAKSLLYDRLQRGELEVEAYVSGEAGGGGTKDWIAQRAQDRVLVDFDRKGWDGERGEYVGVAPCDAAAGAPADPFRFIDSLFKGPEARAELVEYVDEFGRTRWIRPEEQARLEEEREETRRLLVQHHAQSGALAEGGDAPAAAVHYEADGEIRTKGIGFFRFSRDEQDRARQMDALDALRRATVEGRTRALLARERRRLMVESRLARVQDRRRRYNLDGRALPSPHGQQQTASPPPHPT